MQCVSSWLKFKAAKRRWDAGKGTELTSRGRQKQMPSVPLLQWYHRIPHNETYWKNWPSQDNPYINSAYWHRTWLLVLLGLEAAQGVNSKYLLL